MNAGANKVPEKETLTTTQGARDRVSILPTPNHAGQRGSYTMHENRGQGNGRTLPPQRPATSPFTKPGPGMPVPMTGRQKMNEKMRRNNFALATHHSGMYPMPGHLLGARGPVPNSVGDSFKQEIAFLQNELERSTQALEAKIAMLQHTSHEAAFYDGNINVYDTRDWLNEDIGYAGGGYSSENFVPPEMPDFHFPAPPLVRNRRPMLPGFVGGPIQPPPQTYPQDTRGMRRGRSHPRGNANSYW